MSIPISWKSWHVEFLAAVKTAPPGTTLIVDNQALKGLAERGLRTMEREDLNVVTRESLPVVTTQATQRDDSLPIALGYLFVVLGSISAVGAGVYADHSPQPLWALLLVYGLLQKVTEATGGSFWKPAVRGGVMGLLCLLIAVTAFYLNTSSALWAILLVYFLASYIE